MATESPETKKPQERGISLILEVSMVIPGAEGKPPIVDGSRGKKITLPGRSLQGLKPGTPVVITGVDEKEKVRLAEGYPLDKRLVIVEDEPYYARVADVEEYIDCEADFDDITQTETTYDRSHWIGGAGKSGGNRTYRLIEAGKEEEAIRRFTWQQFMNTIYKELGLKRLTAEQPLVRDEELRNSWKVSKFAPEPAARGVSADEKIVRQIVEDHLIPMIIYQRMVERGEISLPEGQITPSHPDFFKTLWEQHREVFCSQHQYPNFTPKDVLAYLLKTKSQFPGPNDGLEKVASPEIVAQAREWSRYSPEASQLLNAANEVIFSFPEVLPVITRSNLAHSFVRLQEAPTLEQVVDFKAIQAIYPLEIEVPNVGTKPVTYKEEVGFFSIPTIFIELTPEELLACKSLPETKSPMYIKSNFVSGYRSELKQLQEQTRVALEQKAQPAKSVVEVTEVTPTPPPAAQTTEAKTKDKERKSAIEGLKTWPYQLENLPSIRGVEWQVSPNTFTAEAEGLPKLPDIPGILDSEGENYFTHDLVLRTPGGEKDAQIGSIRFRKGRKSGRWLPEVDGLPHYEIERILQENPDLDPRDSRLEWVALASEEKK